MLIFFFSFLSSPSTELWRTNSQPLRDYKEIIAILSLFVICFSHWGFWGFLGELFDEFFDEIFDELEDSFFTYDVSIIANFGIGVFHCHLYIISFKFQNFLSIIFWRLKFFIDGRNYLPRFFSNLRLISSFKLFNGNINKWQLVFVLVSHKNEMARNFT